MSYTGCRLLHHFGEADEEFQFRVGMPEDRSVVPLIWLRHTQRCPNFTEYVDRRPSRTSPALYGY